MDAKRNMAKEPQPREGGTRQMEGMDLESVIERARGHDAEALGEIYRRYVRRVLGLCRYMLNSRESAEDATSEVFLKLQRSGEGLGWSPPGEDASEALGSHEGRLDARTLVGLLILTIVGFIPYLGGLVRRGVVCLGLGAFAGQLYRSSRPVLTA